MKWLPWQDIAVFIGIPVAFTALAVVAILTPQEWSTGAIVTLSTALAVCWGTGVAVVLRRYWARPDFITRQGTRVWVGSLPIVKKDVGLWLDFFVSHFDYSLLPHFNHKQDASSKSVGMASMGQLLNRAGIRFAGSSIWGKAGMQSGYSMIVEWKGSVDKSAFWHELLHMVREHNGLPRDYKHEYLAWWGLEKKLIDLWKERQ